MIQPSHPALPSGAPDQYLRPVATNLRNPTLSILEREVGPRRRRRKRDEMPLICPCSLTHRLRKP